MAKTNKPASTSTPKISTKGYKAVEEFNKNIAQSQKQQILNSKELDDIGEDLSKNWKDLADAIKTINSRSAALGENFDEIVDYTKAIYKNIENVGSELYEQVDVSKKINKLAEDRKKQTDNEQNLQSKLQEIQQKILKANATGRKKAVEDLKQKKKEAELSLATSRSEITSLGTRINALKTLESTNNALNKANEAAKKQGIDIQELSGKISEPFEKVLGILDEVPGGGILKQFFGLDSVLEKTQKAVMDSFTSGLANGGSVGSSAFAALRAGATSFMAALGPILIPLLAIAAALYTIKKAFELDQEVTDLAKGLAISKHEAHEIHDSMNEIAASTKVVGASTKELTDAYSTLAKSLGVTKLANDEMAETQVFLTKQMGLSADEAADFQKFSMANGKSAEQNLAVIKAGVESMTGGLMNYKDVSKDIATSSKAVQASYKGNIQALTKAVVIAKKFGMTLDQTKKSADGILDIESSVEAEMKANVLTGKHMNLNAARNLALHGHTAEAMQSMMEQAGDYDELKSMEPIKQKAIADAMNMTVDEMMTAVETQKNMSDMASQLGVTLDENGQLSKEQIAQAAKLGNEEAKKLMLQEQQASAQEKMAAMGDKLMTIFNSLAGPIMEVLDPLMEIVNFAMPLITSGIKLAFAPFMGVIKMISGISKLFHGDIMDGLKDVGEGIGRFFFAPFMYVYDLLTGFFPELKDMVNKAIDYVGGAVKSILPDWAVSLISEDKPAEGAEPQKVHDAMIDPSGGLVVSGQKGSFQLNSQDSVVAGTSLGEQKDDAPSDFSNWWDSMTGGDDNAEIVSLLKELIAKVEQPVMVNIGGRVVDEMEKQTSLRRTYNTKMDSGYGTFG
jgi:hypothetical protein